MTVHELPDVVSYDPRMGVPHRWFGVPHVGHPGETCVTDPAAARAKAEPTPGASEGLDADRLMMSMRNVERRQERFIRWERDAEAIAREYAALDAERPEWRPVVDAAGREHVEYLEAKAEGRALAASPVAESRPTDGASDELVAALTLDLRGLHELAKAYGGSRDDSLNRMQLDVLRRNVIEYTERALAASPVAESPAEPERTDLRAAIERDARLQDALHALMQATLWVNRTADWPRHDDQRAESWRRKARSGIVGLDAFLAASPVAESPAEPERTDLRAALDKQANRADNHCPYCEGSRVMTRPMLEDDVDIGDEDVPCLDSVHVIADNLRTLAAASPSSDTRPELREALDNDLRSFLANVETSAEDNGTPAVLLEDLWALGRDWMRDRALASPPEPPAKEPT